MSKEEPELTPEERLRQENNFLKLKLMAEKGASFFEGNGAPLDPEVENQWLNNIYDFEEQYRDARQIPVYEYIGSPFYYSSDQLDDENVSAELEKLLKVMHDNGVILSCLHEYDDRIIYEFITKELFKYEMDDIRVEGMTSNFIYEEFHPNHERDLRQMAVAFIETLLSNEWTDYDFTLNDEVAISPDKKIMQEEFIDYVELFQDSWRVEEIETEEVTNVWFDLENEQARVDVLLDYKAASTGSTPSRFQGKASVHFEMEFGYWNISEVVVPGFNT